MGYVLKKRTFLLRFEDCEGLSFEGLEVRCRSTSMAKYYELIDLAVGGGGAEDKPTHRAAMAGELASLIVSWNLQEEIDGEVRNVPVTAAGILDQEEYFLIKLFSAWIEAVASVPAPLARTSSGGERSEVPSIQTVNMSDSLESLLMPS
jgi:hypothetical protein